MNLAALKRWHWMVLSVILGGAVAGVWSSIDTPNFNQMGPSFNDQPLFEKLITRDISGASAFRNLTVYPVQIDGQRFHAVVGTRQSQPDLEHTEVFIATTPYIPVAQHGKPATSDSTSTVVAFLRTVPGVSYHYAWWYDPRISTPIFVAASFFLVGLLWPTLINLLVFGAFRRPYQEPAASLMGIPGSTSAVKATLADGQELDATVAQLQDNLGSFDSSAGAEDRPTADQTRLLSGESDTVALIAQEKPRAFGAKPDDFYPTERKAP